VANSLGDIADCYVGLKQYEQALPFRLRALEIRENIYGPEHLEIFSCTLRLGDLLTKMQRWEQAIPVFKRALAICEIFYGSEHTEHVVTAYVIYWLALAYTKLNQYEQSLPLLQRALGIYEKFHDAKHHSFIYNTILLLAEVYEKLEQWNEALPLRQRALEICKKIHGTEHEDTAQAFFSLSDVYEKLGQPDQVIEMLCNGILMQQNLAQASPQFDTGSKTSSSQDVCDNVSKKVT
jgi:tetratricopeptide (TPR) repeat protein